MAVPQSSPTRLGPPASGAYICPVLSLSNLVTSTAVTAKMKLPAGMTAVLVGASIQGHGITSDPAVIVGNSTDTDGYVTATNLTTLVNNPSIGGALAANGRASIPSGGNIIVTITNDSGDDFKIANVALTMYVTEHATNIPDV